MVRASECLEVTLKPVYMEQSDELLGKARLRKFQKELVDRQDGAIILTAPTGSGKTIALLTDVKRRISVGFYPNNELLLSQISGLNNFIINYLGMKLIERDLLDYAMKPEGIPESADYAPFNLYEEDSGVDIFGHHVKKIWILGLSGRVIKRVGEKGKLEVLRETVNRLVGIKDSYGVIIATPDTYFLLALYAYGDLGDLGRIISTVLSLPPGADAEYIENVLRVSGLAPREKLSEIISVFLPIKDATIFVDEYHLYDPYELSSFRVLMYLLKEVHEWSGRLIFSSATPNIEFAKEVAKKADLQPKELKAIGMVRESGDAESLVRGELKLIFLGVDTGRISKVSMAYGASEKAIDLLEEGEVEDFMERYKGGTGRGMVILEKVSHADAFTEEVNRIYGVKPVCLFSTAPPGFPTTIPEHNRDDGALLMVGTGARIGQGVEFRNVTFGIVARATSHDYLQSLSRIGRRTPERSVVLTPIDIKLLDKLMKEIKTEMGYGDLVKWVEETKVFRHGGPEEPSVYTSLINAREHLLKMVGLSLFYRHAGTWTEEVRRVLGSVCNVGLRILSPPDEIYKVAMFRSTGPEVAFCRGGGKGALVEGRDDLGTIIRNYVVDVDNKGRLVLVERGRGELLIRCCGRSRDILREMGRDLSAPTLVSWSFLRNVFKCECVDADGHRLDPQFLEDQLFMAIDTDDRDMAEFLAITGRGLRVDLGRETKTLILIFV